MRKKTVKPKCVMTRQRRVRLNRGHTLLEAMMAAFLALITALIFSATIPIANFTRGKAENVNLATSLAAKTIEAVRGDGYPNTTAQRLYDNNFISSTSQVNIGSLGIGTAGEMAYDASDADSALVDSAAKVLPSGKGYIKTEQVDLELRRITVIIAWKEKDVWKTVRMGTLVANL